MKQPVLVVLACSCGMFVIIKYIGFAEAVGRICDLSPLNLGEQVFKVPQN
jgi:hypothetical protein